MRQSPWCPRILTGLIEGMTTDTLFNYRGTVIQHGPLNDRVYLMKLGPDSTQSTLDWVEELARKHHYSKICAKVPASAREVFVRGGYTVEAFVPGFFNGREDCYFFARYLDPRRREIPDADIIEDVLDTAHRTITCGMRCIKSDADIIEDVLDTALSRSQGCRSCPPPNGFRIRPAKAEDAPALAALYGTVFETYPFPIHDSGYILETMETHIRYYCVIREGRIVAASSAETDRDSKSVEMTDFATHSSFRGMGLCSALLEQMEGDMHREGMHLAYTIARAAMYPINITFARAGYIYGGTLLNNTNICGSFESMNVWYKNLK
jgi:putative beta-lysine N-acetyltransferase